MEAVVGATPSTTTVKRTGQVVFLGSIPGWATAHMWEGARLICRPDEMDEWLHMSIALLKSLLSVSWLGIIGSLHGGRNHHVGTCQAPISPFTRSPSRCSPLSVSLKMTCVSCPPNFVQDQMEAAEYLVQYEPMPVMDSTMEPIGQVMDDVLKIELKGNGIVSHHLRLFWLSQVADQWV
jgi:hypothetical protein